VRVEAEQTVYTYAWPGNGADAFWTSSPTIVRHGETVYASGIEVMPKARNPNNLRWTLFKSTGGRLVRIADGGDTREREPCPLGLSRDGSLLLSSNPVTKDHDQSTAHILSFPPQASGGAYEVSTPKWVDKFQANQHSYRSFSADAANNTVMLFYQNPMIHQTHWVCYKNGELVKNGKIDYPRGMYGTRGVVMRVCYPAMQIKDYAVHYIGVTDIQEPIPEIAKTRSAWVFRRLRYMWTPDIRTQTFSKWIEIANHDATDGYVKAMDIHIDSPTRARILWFERELTTVPALRKSLAANRKQRIAVNCSVMENGKLISTTPVVEWREGEPGDSKPVRAVRFHKSKSGRLYVLYRTGVTHRIAELKKDGVAGDSVQIPLKNPCLLYFTASPRSGSTPSDTIDFLGQSKWGRHPHSVYYARIKLTE